MSENEKKIYQIIMLVFLLLSVPIIVLSFYNVPSADDYSFGYLMKKWVSENGYHFGGMLKCAAQNMINYYYSWQGRYSESFLASFMPDLFGLYWLSAIVMFFMLVGSIIYLYCALAKNLAGKKYIWAGVWIGLLISTAIVQNIPFPVEAFYWFDGAMAYTLHHSFYLWMCGVVINYLGTKRINQKAGYMILLVVLAVLAAGGNVVTSFISIFTWIVFLMIVLLILHRGYEIIIPFIVSIGGFLVSYLSPGTAIRGGGSENYAPALLTIIKCFRWTLRQYILTWTNVAILLMLCFLTPLFLKILLVFVEEHDFKFRFPGIIAAGGICFLSAMSAPPFYVLGESGPGRLRNVIYINYILLFVLMYGYVLGWIVVKEKNNVIVKEIPRFYEKLPLQKSVCLIVVVFGLLCAGNAQRWGVSIEAAKELASGQARRYHSESVEREKIYLESEQRDIEVSPYSVKPYLLFFDDITDNPENWKNTSISEYFGKRTIKLNRYDSDVAYD